MVKEITVRAGGMSCLTCEGKIEAALNKLDGVERVKANYASESVLVRYDETKVDEEKIRKAIEDTGYDAGEERKQKEKKGLFGLDFLKF